jgi:hypothetical protein
MCLIGLTNADLAEVFEVNEHTITLWMQTREDFADAIFRGRVEADANVAYALYRRAIGYTYEDVHISTYQGEAVVVPVIKHMHPDVFAAKTWLSVRQRERWANVQKFETSSTIDVNFKKDINELTEADREILKRMTIGQLSPVHGVNTN